MGKFNQDQINDEYIKGFKFEECSSRDLLEYMDFFQGQVKTFKSSPSLPKYQAALGVVKKRLYDINGGYFGC